VHGQASTAHPVAPNGAPAIQTVTLIPRPDPHREGTVDDILTRIRSGAVTAEERDTLAELVLAIVLLTEAEDSARRAAEAHAGWVARVADARAKVDTHMTKLVTVGCDPVP